MVTDTAGGRVILFGGTNGLPGPQIFLDDTWAYASASGWQAVNQTTRPPARAAARMAEVYARWVWIPGAKATRCENVLASSRRNRSYGNGSGYGKRWISMLRSTATRLTGVP